MKKLYTVLMAFAAATMIFTSCSESNDAFFTASEDDYPRILNTDIPEASGGGRASLPSITRDNNFVFDVIVTPAEYTTVTWLVDGQQVYEGKSIDYSLIAGIYDVDIVATTTKGKSTKRMCSLEVLPLDTDPALAQDDKSLWCQIGTLKTIPVTNFDGINTMYIAGQKISDFQNNGSTITFTVPELNEGNQKVVVETADGVKYGCGTVNISKTEWVEPGFEVVNLWSGNNALNWDAENIKVTAEQLAEVPVGTELTITFNKIPAEEMTGDIYWALRITTPWWGDNDSDNLLSQTDFGSIEGNEYKLTYDDHCKALVDERGAMCLVGNGLVIKSITYTKKSPNAETKLWEGNNALNWDAENVKVTADQLAEVSVGKTILIYFDKIPAEEMTGDIYWALRITTPWWGDNDSDNLLSQTDFGSIEESPYAITYDDHCKALVDERGAMCLVGNGLKITKISYM